MKKFIIIYHSKPNSWEQNKETTKEDMQKGMDAWMAWSAKCGYKLLDMGSPLGNGISLNPNGESSASAKEVMGYSILSAENMEEAKILMDGHPHLSWDASCSIEIHECLPLPGM